jgi:signal transduction histidine kinase
MEGVYALIHELRPPALDDLGLRAALEVLVDRATAASGLELESSFDLPSGESDAGRLPEEIETAVYRLVQEAVNNAIKHADPDRVTVAVEQRGGILHARVSDDGVGFDPERDQRGFGLAGMRERAALLGGRVSVDSAIGRGTVVGVELPITGSRRSSAGAGSALDQVVVEREADQLRPGAEA